MAAVFKSCTDLFQKNAVDVSYTSTSWEEVQARELTNFGQTVDFTIQSTEAAYLQLSGSVNIKPFDSARNCGSIV